MKDTDLHREAIDIFRQCEDREKDNRIAFEEDIRFGRLEEQWPKDIAAKREREGRPMHVINKLGPVIRQVVNDARQNKPSISIRPQDNNADPETAEILSGLIRNIESSSNADIAYDTAVENAVAGGFGYIRINLDYAHNDTFDKDIVIDRVPNPLSIYGDPESFSADGSDWNQAFVTDRLPTGKFEKRYKDATKTDFASDYEDGWIDDDHVTIAEWWTRDEIKKQIIQLSDGQIVPLNDFEGRAEYFYSMEIEPVGSPRDVRSYKVTQHLMTGAEILETNEWPGCYIPIVPVYGDEIVLKDKRYLRSLIRSARSAQERYNYWMTAMTEMVALAPRVPFIGEQGAFDVDPNWSRVNSDSIPFLEFKRGMTRPERQPSPQISAGMMQEAMSAAEDIKSVTGIFDASLGARSNETSGVAIRERDRKGSVSTFHFIDNLTRSIRQVGRVCVDLVPKVYTQDRVIRILGEDGKSEQLTLGQPDEKGRIFDLSTGKYDVAVKSGPSYTTQREETRAELVEIIKAVPESAKLLGPMYLRNSDWPGADEAADLLEGKGEQGQIPPEVQQQIQQMQQVIQQGGARLQELERENEQLKAANEIKAAEAVAKNKEADAKLIEAKARAHEALIPKPVQQPAPQPSQQPAGSPFAMEGSV